MSSHKKERLKTRSGSKESAGTISCVFPRIFVGERLVITGDELRRAGNTSVINSLKNIDPSFMVVENLENGSDPNMVPEIQFYGQTGLSNGSTVVYYQRFQGSVTSCDESRP